MKTKPIETNNYIYDFNKMIKISKKTKIQSPLRIDNEGMMIDFWDSKQNEWIWDDEATIAFKNNFALNSSNQTNITDNEKKVLLDVLDTVRLDAILEENKFDQDEIGLIMAKLGDKEMESIHLK